MKNKTALKENYATVNPCYNCMPLGAIIAGSGFEKTCTLLHGSQGCATYMRRHLSRHFQEPVDAGSSSLNEKDAIYGGEENLKKAVINIYKQYDPKMIVVISTCLSETIGDDIPAIINEIENISKAVNIPLAHVSCPSYAGSYTNGYWKAVKAVLEKKAKQNTEIKVDTINIIPGIVTPKDLRCLSKLGKEYGIKFNIFGDYSERFDAPWNKVHKIMPDGGTKLSSVEDAGDAAATIEFSVNHPETDSPAVFLKNRFGVPFYRIPYPAGLKNTDRFFKILKSITDKDTPAEIQKERGRLLDAMADAHKILFDKRAVIFGDSEYMLSVYCCLKEWGMRFSGVVSDKDLNLDIIENDYKNIIGNKREDAKTLFINNGSMHDLEEWLRSNKIDILLGSSMGSSISLKYDIPLVRRGFPIHDRFGAGRSLTIGYEGTLALLDDVSNAFAGILHSSFRKDLGNKYLNKERDYL
ncbi:MAG: nitrogenase component 1 [bacterium]